MTDTNKSSNPLKAILFKSPWSLRFSFIITVLLVLLSFANIILFSFLGMQINSIVFLAFSLISFVFVFVASLETAAGKTTLNWVMFLVTVAAFVIAASTTSFFKSVPKVELDNISATLIALSFGCSIVVAYCNNNYPIEIEKDDSEDTVIESTGKAELEASEETGLDVSNESASEDNTEEKSEEVSEESTEDNK